MKQFITQAAAVAVLTLLSMPFVAADTITYADVGGTSRPVFFDHFTVSPGNYYDVTITYNNNGATNPLRVGDLADADIDDAGTAMAAALNGLNPDDASPTLIYFTPNTDLGLGFGPDWFEWQNQVADNSNGENTWFSVATDGAGLGFVQSGGSNVGFATFVTVPEPGAIGFLITLSVCCVGVRRRRRG